MSNNDDSLGGLGDILKNVDLSQLTSLISSFNTKTTESDQDNSLASKIDLSKISSLISNIDLGQIGNLISSFRPEQSEDQEQNSILSNLNLGNFNLENLGLDNLKNLNFDNLKDSGLFNFEELQSALSDFTEKMQGFRKL